MKKQSNNPLLSLRKDFIEHPLTQNLYKTIYDHQLVEEAYKTTLKLYIQFKESLNPTTKN